MMHSNRLLVSKRLGVAALAALALGGCSLNLASDPPASLLTLTPETTAPQGASAATGAEGSEGAIAVLTPEVPAKLNVARVPVSVSDTQIAYLQEAVWVERPARLFRRLLGEALRSRTEAFVLDSDDTPTIAAQTLRGTLRELGYDARTSSVVIRFDAVRTSGSGGVVETRRFEARESGVAAETAFVGPALNRVANRVANEVADWMTGATIPPSAPPIMDETAG